MGLSGVSFTDLIVGDKCLGDDPWEYDNKDRTPEENEEEYVKCMQKRHLVSIIITLIILTIVLVLFFIFAEYKYKIWAGVIIVVVAGLMTIGYFVRPITARKEFQKYKLECEKQGLSPKDCMKMKLDQRIADAQASQARSQEKIANAQAQRATANTINMFGSFLKRD